MSIFCSLLASVAVSSASLGALDLRVLDALQPSGSIWLISVGIDEYQDKAVQDLAAGQSDAKRMASQLSRLVGRRLIGQSVLLNGTKLEEVEQAFQKAAAGMGPTDLLLLHFSGQGTMEYSAAGEDGSLAMLLSDSTIQDGKASRVLTTKLLKTWLDRTPSRFQVLLLDTCFSEAFGKEFRQLVEEDRSRYGKVYNRRLAAFTAGGLTFEDAQRGGVMTSAFLEALSGGAAMPSGSPGAAAGRKGPISTASMAAYFPWAAYVNGPERWLTSRHGSFLIGDPFVILDPSKQQASPTRGTPVEPPPALAAREGGDYALLIGVGSYDDPGFPPLPNAGRDAEALGSLLKEQFGFQVDVLAGQVSVADMVKKLEGLQARKWRPHDQLLVFFAGHGFIASKDSREGCIAGTDSLSPGKSGLLAASRALSHSVLKQALADVPCSRVMLVMDSCHSGAFDPEWNRGFKVPQGSSELLASIDPQPQFRSALQMLARPTRRFLTSGRPAESVPDGIAGEGSPFAKELEKLLVSLAQRDGVVLSSALSGAIALAGLESEPRYGVFAGADPGVEFVFIPKRSQPLPGGRRDLGLAEQR